MASSPPWKKTKYDVEPGVLSGAKSASELAKGEDSDVGFSIDPAPLSRFFPVPVPAPASVQPEHEESHDSDIRRQANAQYLDMTWGVMTTLHFTITENAYRNAIYRELTGKKYNLQTVPGTRKRFAYEEMDLMGLFRAFVEMNAVSGNISTEERDELFSRLRRKEHGLKITSGTSLPDLSFLRRVNGNFEFVLGEVKHASCHSRQNAQQQAACYLQALLYFLRVKLGLPVTTVYGFAICGSKCSGIQSTFMHPKYAVGFVKLIAPNTLDGRFEVQSYWKESGALDSSGLKLLIHFLKCGNSYEYDPIGSAGTDVWSGRRVLEARCPSLYTILVSLWQDTDGRRLVVTQSLAAVFRVSQNAAEQLLNMIVAEADGEPDLADTMKGKAVKASLHELDFNAGFVYIKIHTTETTKHLMSSTFADIWRILKEFQGTSSAISDFFQTYPIEPPSFSNCSFVVMYDRGESLRHVNLGNHFENFSSARPELRALKLNVEELEKFCFHGDILPHNVAVDKGKLTLFDYDEALPLKSNPPRRVIPDQVNVYRRLSYPNVLRKNNKKEYSSIQFSLTVRFIAESLDCSDRVSKNLTQLSSCHETLADMLDFDILTDELQHRIWRHVQELVAVVDSILAEDLEGEPLEDEGEKLRT